MLQNNSIIGGVCVWCVYGVCMLCLCSCRANGRKIFAYTSMYTNAWQLQRIIKLTSDRIIIINSYPIFLFLTFSWTYLWRMRNYLYVRWLAIQFSLIPFPCNLCINNSVRHKIARFALAFKYLQYIHDLKRIYFIIYLCIDAFFLFCIGGIYLWHFVARPVSLWQYEFNR